MRYLIARDRGKESRAILVNYYNERMNKCLIEIKTIDIVNNEGELFINKSLEDTEGREYAVYLSDSMSGKVTEDIRPSICEIYLSSGETMECHSSDELTS